MKAIIVVRAFDPDTNGPVVPGGWDLVQEDRGWWSIHPLGRTARPDVFVHALRLRSDPDTWLEYAGFGAFVVAGEVAYLSAIKSASAHAYTYAEVRAGGDPVTNFIRNNVDSSDAAARLKATISGHDYPQAADDTDPGDIP